MFFFLFFSFTRLDNKHFPLISQKKTKLHVILHAINFNNIILLYVQYKILSWANINKLAALTQIKKKGTKRNIWLERKSLRGFTHGLSHQLPTRKITTWKLYQYEPCPWQNEHLRDFNCFTFYLGNFTMAAEHSSVL